MVPGIMSTRGKSLECSGQGEPEGEKIPTAEVVV